MSAMLLVGGVAASCGAQAIQLGGGFDRAAEAHKPHVALLSDTVTVPAGKPQDVELQFRVQDGFHINSHRPKDELLLPTRLTVEGGHVRLLGESYPNGKSFRLEVGAGEMLDVYEGDFRVGLRVEAPRGASVLQGELHYQACDRAACYPPRVLAVKVLVTGQ